MRYFRFRKKVFSLKNYLIVIGVLIIICTSFLISTIGRKSSENIIFISRNLINNLSTNTVNSNIKLDLLKKYSVNDLININYQDKTIVNIDYNLETAYEILIYIKQAIIQDISNEIKDIYNYDYKLSNNKVIVEIPFYSYTNNILISNLGPKIRVQLSMIRLIDGSVKTKIKTYGINSLLVELYINFTITSTIVVPNTKEVDTTNNYDILISSKVIQGEIPSLYNGLLENSSQIITT